VVVIDGHNLAVALSCDRTILDCVDSGALNECDNYNEQQGEL
jgi:hypothetical protein